MKATHEAAIAAPGDAAKRNALKAELPYLADLDAYVVEGDLLITSDHLEEYLERVHDDRERVDSARVDGAADRLAVLLSPELKVNYLDGEPDIWSVTRRAKISYAIDQSSFGGETPDFMTVKKNLGLAAKAWEDACPACDVHFVHDEAVDSAPSFDRVLVIVKRYDAGGDFIAQAPFPSTPVDKRYLYVDPSYFRTTYDRVGVFRHELGHLLGYRHEQIDRLSGCYHSEDDEWEALTPYDPKSVMHYYCGKHGTKTLELTEVDCRAHQKLYRK